MKEFFKITSVSRDDLEALGYNTSKVSDRKMEHLAKRLADDYLEQLFWTSLDIMAEFLEMPKRRKKKG